MKTIDLNGTWWFKAIDTYKNLPSEKKNLSRWMQALVPGTVHLDLLRNKKIPDPFIRMNETEVQWVDSVGWLYRKEFVVDKEFLGKRKVCLLAEGLDTYANIRCNGVAVGETANMFVEHRFDVKEYLRVGKNTIEILFDSPTGRSKALQEKHGTLKVALESHRVYVRKAQYAFGWDWGPRLTTSGIWRNIYLEAYSDSRLHHPFAKVIAANGREAVILCSAEIERVDKSSLRFCASVGDHGTTIGKSARIKGQKASIKLRIPRPKFWWPNGYGDQPVYNANFSLMKKNSEIHAVVVPFAIRTVRLIQQKNSIGSSFLFEINGKKIFCKGANWIPNDTFIPRIRPSTYETLLRMAKDAHMNMIRVWGGGIYEQGIFYGLCDKLGLMVWQDFMFACGEYPETKWFQANVKKEAESVVKRLRNHPSIVLWCGNNECEWLFCRDNPEKTPDDMQGSKMFREILPAMCAEHDGTRPYWRSSPFGKGFPNAESNGNHHQWVVWSSWEDYKMYEKDNARFVTEFGFQGVANRRTMEEFTFPADRHPQSLVMEHHNKQTDGTERLLRFQAAHYQVNSNFDDFIYKSQLTQAEALKFGVEHWRRRKFATAGTLLWQLNDCWPVCSWSVVDCRLRPKAGYYFAKKFFAPILLSFKSRLEFIDIWVTNDLFRDISAELMVAFQSFSGKVIWRNTRKVHVRSNSSKRVHHIMRDLYARYPVISHYLNAQLYINGNVASENRFFFTEPKHLLLPSPHIEKHLEKLSDKSFLLILKSNVFIKSVRVEFQGEDVDLGDNYFDLDPRRRKSVRLVSNLSLSRLQKKLRLKWV